MHTTENSSSPLSAEPENVSFDGKERPWSDTESAWSGYYPRTMRNQMHAYPPSTRFPAGYSRPYGGYRTPQADWRRHPAEERHSTSVLWQLTATLALVVIVFCSYQSNQSWAGKVRDWAGLAMAWDYPADQMAGWVKERWKQLQLPHIEDLRANRTGGQ